MAKWCGVRQENGEIKYYCSKCGRRGNHTRNLCTFCGYPITGIDDLILEKGMAGAINLEEANEDEC